MLRSENRTASPVDLHTLPADDVLALFPAGVAADAPLMDSGLDSLGAVEFRSSLEASLSVQLPPTLVFDYPSLSAIVSYLDDTLAAQQPAPAATSQPAKATAARTVAAPTTGPSMQLAAAGQVAAPIIAVLATHGRFPELRAPAAAAHRGLAGQLSLRDAISVVPVERYDVEMQLTEDMPARFGGFIPGAQVSTKLLTRPDSNSCPGCRRDYASYCKLAP